MSNVDSGERTTRRPHQCAYCAYDIPSGTRARWWTWTDTGQIGTSYGHQECELAYWWYAHELGLRVGDELMDPGDFRSEVLAAYRREVVAAAGLISAVDAGTPHDSGEV